MHPINLIVAAIVLLAVAAMLLRGYLRHRGARLVTCPENHRPAGVSLNAGHALFTGLEGKTDLRLNSCSRWPELRDCGQECLNQIEAAPEGCLVRNILIHWYAGKTCAMCSKPIGEINWVDHQPALLSPELRSVDWRDVPAEKVPEILATHRAVCWNCHVVNKMVAEHGELLLSRARRA